MWWLLLATASATDFCVPAGFDRGGLCDPADVYASVPAAITAAEGVLGSHTVWIAPGYDEGAPVRLRGGQTAMRIDVRGSYGEPVTFSDTFLMWNDLDSDGYGDPFVVLDACTHPPTYVANDGDCDDSQPAAWTNAPEICDGVDNDCDGAADGSDAIDATDWWPDLDNDFFGAGAPVRACNQPAGHRDNALDCDDTDNSTNPMAPEQCDAVDHNCNGPPDDGITTQDWYFDGDDDGFGDSAIVVSNCLQPAHHVPLDADCDDTDATVNPGVVEFCDGVDDNCSGDEDDGVDPLPFYPDFDGDGWGENGTVIYACEPGPGNALRVGDCLDTDANVNPDAVEECDGIDNNCDGVVDAAAVDAVVHWPDEDGDGFGVDGAMADAFCIGEAPAGWAPNNIDCDDGEPLAWGGAPEVCDGVDNDCDGLLDDDDDDAQGLLVSWPDLDGDTYGDEASPMTSGCELPVGNVLNDGDCNDAEPLAWTDAPEVCDGVDNDCDAAVDAADDDVVDEVTDWWPDADGDGFGDKDADPVSACSPPGEGFVLDASDCDDSTDLAAPDLEEVCGDGIDNDCDGLDDACGAAPRPTGCGCRAPGPPGWVWITGLALLLARRRAA